MEYRDYFASFKGDSALDLTIKFKNEAKKYILFFIGLSLIALGSVHMIKVSNLGVQPFDTLYLGLHRNFSISIGTSSIMIGCILLAVSFLLTKQKLKVGTILDTVFLGLFVDLFLHIDLIIDPNSLFLKYIVLIFGTVLISFGAALTIYSDLGAGPIDTFMLSIHRKFHLSVKLSTTIIEMMALVIGFLLGGPFGFGTLLFLFSIGPLMEFFLYLLNRRETVEAPSIGEKVS